MGSPFAEFVIAVVGAGRGRLVWARYDVSAEGLAQSRSPRNGTVSELVEELRESGPVLVTGEIDDDQAGLFARIDGVSLPPGPLRMRQPGALAELAWRRWRLGSSMRRERSSQSTSRAELALDDA